MATPLRILYIGDVVGKGGRLAVQKLVPTLRQELKLDGVFMNAENLAHGRGITPETIAAVEEAGIDYCSSGNHIYDNPRGVEILHHEETRVLRPANFPESDPGKGYATITLGEYTILLINLIGRVFMEQPAANPFTTIREILNAHTLTNYSAVIVDIHAEATSEILGLGMYVDGDVSVVVGTHTHVPTADLRILPGGTGVVCDLGSVAAEDSVLGFNKEAVLDRFLNDSRTRLDPIESGTMLFNSVLLEIDPTTRKLTSIQRIDRAVEV